MRAAVCLVVLVVLTSSARAEMRQEILGLEIGLGIGAGIVTIPTGNNCDGSCDVGGAPIIISPVVRYAVSGIPHVTLGGVLRLVIPIGGLDTWGVNKGFGMVAMLGLDGAFGL